MKYLLVSDIHGSLFYTKKLEEIIAKEQPNKIIFLGDLYYHGPRNPLPKDYSPMEVCKIFNHLKDKLIAIKGNCDAEVDEMISEFKFRNSYCFNFASRNICTPSITIIILGVRGSLSCCVRVFAIKKSSIS